MPDFILSFSHKGDADLTPQQRFLNAHNELRNNGCHSPTHRSILLVFKTIKQLVLIEKLKKTNPLDQVRNVSMHDFVRKLNGPGSDINFTGNGVEFTGWYTELYLLKVAGLIGISRGAFEIKPWFYEKAINPSKTEDEIHEWLINTMEEHHVRLREEIVGRCNRFGISHVLLELAYAGCDPDESWLKSDQCLPNLYRS